VLPKDGRKYPEQGYDQAEYLVRLLLAMVLVDRPFSQDMALPLSSDSLSYHRLHEQSHKQTTPTPPRPMISTTGPICINARFVQASRRHLRSATMIG